MDPEWGPRARGGQWGILVGIALLTPTFLGDADGTAAHAHTQPVHTSINQVLGLRCCHHWGGGEEGLEERGKRNSVRMGCPCLALGLPGTPVYPPPSNSQGPSPVIQPSAPTQEQCHHLGMLKDRGEVTQ